MASPDRLTRHELVHPDGRRFLIYGDARPTLAGGRPDDRSDTGLHRRFDRLTDAWVLISPARNTRPAGRTDGTEEPPCPLCPGGPELPGPFELAVFDNRYPPLTPDPPPVPRRGTAAELVATSVGRCQVVVFTPAHTGSLATLGPARLGRLVAVLQDRTSALWDDGHAYVMAFENRGGAVGATLSHPHGQLYALGHLPPTVRTKMAVVGDHRRRHGGCLGCAVVADDTSADRQIEANPSFSVAVPFAARWPFELRLTARRHGVGRLSQLDGREASDLAGLLGRVVARYDGLFGFALPYLLCIQEAPAGPDGAPLADWHLHVELSPPHRSAERLKVRASVETALGTFINDTVPEDSAARLRAVAVPDLPAPRVPAIAVAR